MVGNSSNNLLSYLFHEQQILIVLHLDTLTIKNEYFVNPCLF